MSYLRVNLRGRKTLGRTTLAVLLMLCLLVPGCATVGNHDRFEDSSASPIQYERSKDASEDYSSLMQVLLNFLLGLFAS